MKELDALRHRYDRKKELPAAVQVEEEPVAAVTQTKADEHITDSNPPVIFMNIIRNY